MNLISHIPLLAQKIWETTLKPFLDDPLLLNKWDSPQSRDKIAGRITAVVNTGYKRLISHGDYKLDLYMFMEDMTNFIMPFSHRISNLQVSLQPKSKSKEKIVIESFNHQRSRDLTEAVGEFIREAGQSLFSHSEVFYEVKVSKNNQGKVTKLEFFDIYTPSMSKIFGRYFQFIPWKAAESARTKAGIRSIPKESVLHIEFPERLGGKKGHRKVIKRLAAISKTHFPDFHLKSFEQNKQTGFDLNAYVESKYIEKAQLTKKLGWNQRKIPDNSILEYYSIHRHLMFAYSQAMIREHILKQLNIVLHRELGTKVVIEGLLTTSEIEKEQKLFMRGDIEFNELFKRTSQY